MKYCPYCGAMEEVVPDVVVAHAEEAVFDWKSPEHVAEATVAPPMPESVSAQLPPVEPKCTTPDSPQKATDIIVPEVKHSEQKSESVLAQKAEKPSGDPVQPVHTPPKSDNIKWIAIAAVLIVAIIGYVITNKKGDASLGTSDSRQSSNLEKKGNVAPEGSGSRQTPDSEKPSHKDTAEPYNPTNNQGEQTSQVPVPSQIHFSPSFDCGRAVSASERLICSDEELSRLDVRMAALFRAARGKAVNKTAFKNEQKAWLRYQRDVSPDKQSMVRVYHDRIEQLSNY